VSQEPSPARGFQEGLAAGELRFQRCGDCAATIFYPRVACPSCGGTQLGWQTAAGTGTVYSTTAIPVRDGEPYNVTLVDLDEGFRVMTRVAGVAADAVRIGSRGRLEVTRDEDGPPTVFHVDSDEAAR
jgi:uncharacterized OB-fold protein